MSNLERRSFVQSTYKCTDALHSVHSEGGRNSNGYRRDCTSRLHGLQRYAGHARRVAFDLWYPLKCGKPFVGGSIRVVWVLPHIVRYAADSLAFEAFTGPRPHLARDCQPLIPNPPQVSHYVPLRGAACAFYPIAGQRMRM